MMAASAAKRGTKPPTDPLGSAAPASAEEAKKGDLRVDPLKPRPVLLAVTSLVFAGWVAFLVALYVKTEYPRRSIAPRPDAKGDLVPAMSAPTAR